MTIKPSSSGAWVRGVDASTGMLLQPKGSVPRASNLILTKRGSLRTCDGSAIVTDWAGVGPTTAHVQALCDFYYVPTGATSPLIMRIMRLLDRPLGPPHNLAAADGGAGGSLSGTYYYVVTAIDSFGSSVGNETTASNEATVTVAASHKVNLTWNVVPNAFGYRLWRSTSPGAEKLLQGPSFFIPQVAAGTLSVSFTDTGYSTSIILVPPLVDNSQQTGLFVIPGDHDLQFDYSNMVAVWPATIPDAQSEATNTNVGMVSLIPQIVQFVNKAIIALGNAYPPQIYISNSPVTITGITIDAYGVATVTTSGAHGLTVGSNDLINNVNPSQFNGTFIVLSVPSPTTFKVRNLAAIGQTYVSGGSSMLTTAPITSTFQAQFPAWVAKGSYALNSIVQPITAPTSYFQAIAPADGGVSGTTEPTWPQTGGSDGNGLGLTVQDGNITWRNAGTIASAAPPPPGAAHITVYAGALFALNTYPLNTTNGLDGPCCLRMSDVNNPNSWNPVNTAFLDKDDGTQGEGLVTFTITAQGIPPEGSLVACKLYASYQVVGVFGSANFAIQRVVTDMGCTAPRTLQFVPGYGIGRVTHLGIAVFDGVADRIISPQVVPFLFQSNDPELADITTIDGRWTLVCKSALTSNPTMYCIAIPVGATSGGALTRLLCFDLVLKAWAVIDLPFSIMTIIQARFQADTAGTNSTAVTLIGSFTDTTLQRWQAADVTWATAVAGSSLKAPVAWSVRTPPTASKDPEERLYCRRAVVVGQSGSGILSPITIQPRINGVAQTAQKVSVPASGRFAVQASVNATSDLFDAIVSGSGDITIDGMSFDVTPKPLGVTVGMIG